MANDNLEIELKRVEVIHEDINITLTNTQYNGFIGVNGSFIYQEFLEKIYDEYFIKLRDKIENLVFDKNEMLSQFLTHKIVIFKNIKNEFENKSVDYDFYIADDRREIASGNKNQSLKKQHETLIFLSQMKDVQLYFINKAIGELEGLNAIYNQKLSLSTEIETTVKKEQKGKRESYVHNYFNDYFKEKEELTIKDLETIFGVQRQTVWIWETENKIKRLKHSTRRCVLYSKQDIINNIIDGVLPKGLNIIK